MQQKTILILGHRGFIGQHVTEEFLANGWQVIGVSRNSLESTNKNLLQYKVDLSSEAGLLVLRDIISEYDTNIMLNLVWDVAANCHQSPTAYASKATVIDISKTFISTKTTNKKELITIGTNAEYMPVSSCWHRLREDDPEVIQPDSIYGVCKYETFKILEKLCSENDIVFKWPRVFSTFGKNMRPTCFMPSLIKAIKANEAYVIRNGWQMPHFTPVEFVADSIYKLVNDNPGVTTGAVNIACRVSASVQSVANLLIESAYGNTDNVKLDILEKRVIEQHPSLVKHDLYIKNSKVYDSPIPYIKAMHNYY